MILASDAVHVFEEVDEERPFAIFYDLPGMLEGYRRINRLAGSRDPIVPGHDARDERLSGGGRGTGGPGASPRQAADGSLAGHPRASCPGGIHARCRQASDIAAGERE